MRRSPSLSRKSLASAATRSGGGSSATKWRTSFVATWRAVAGWRARSSRTARPCSTRVRFAEDCSRARLAPIRLEVEGAGRARLAQGSRDAPAGDGAGELGDVGLRVARADAERVELEDFTREVFVESLAGEPPGTGVGTDRVLVVEEEDHRRMTLRGPEQRGEFAERVRTDRLALERPGGDAHGGPLGGGYGEMVRPEGDEPLDEAGPRPQLVGEPRFRLRPEQSLLDRRLRRLAFCRSGLGRLGGHEPGRRRHRSGGGPDRGHRGRLGPLGALLLLIEVEGLQGLGP